MTIVLWAGIRWQQPPTHPLLFFLFITTIYTTYTKREALLVAEALKSAGWFVEVVANSDDLGIYDQWACVGRVER